MLTHHAYFLEGELREFDALAHMLRENERFEPHDPGFVARQYDKFGIDEARDLIANASLKNTGGRTLFVLGVGSMTSEAQQSLLKLFEEPQQGTQFVLLLPHGTLLPTLRSRMLDLRGPKNSFRKSPRVSPLADYLQVGKAGPDHFSSEFSSLASAARTACSKMTGRFFSCSRLARVGKTPPYGACSSACERRTLPSTRNMKPLGVFSPSTIAIPVSSQDVSMAKTRILF
jgi:hypothetical protein